MKFSIIIPTLNEAANIQTCLLSIQKQNYLCEIIIVDGGSTDNTLEIAKPWVDIITKSSKSRAIQMNAGAQKAQGDLLLFLHADTLLPNNALETLDRLYQQQPAFWGRFNIKLSGQHPMLRIIAFLMNWRSCLTGIATGDQVIFVNKTLFNSVGGYPEIALMEDIKLSSILKKTHRPYCLKTKVTSSGRRWEHHGVFKTIFLMWSMRIRYFLGENPKILCTLYTEGKLWKT